MTTFSPAQDAAAKQPIATWFAALEILYVSQSNLLSNPSGPGIAGWTNNATEAMQFYTSPTQGDFFFAQAASNSNPFQYYQDVAVSASTAYDLKAAVHADALSGAGTQVRAYVEWLDSGKASLGYSTVAEISSATGTGDTWAEIQTGSITSPANAAFARILIDCYSPSSTWAVTNAYWAGLQFAPFMQNFALRLLDGSGTLTLFGNTFVGADPVYGAFESIDKFSDGTADQSPTLSITMLPPSNAATTALAAASAQGSPVSLWVGIVNPVTGLPVSDPDLRFIGTLDTAPLEVDQNSKKLKLVCVSAFEQFFRDDEGVRLSDPWHQSIWPGELGLQFVTNVQVAMPWGSDAPRPVLVTDITAQQSNAASAAASIPSGFGVSFT